MFKPCPNCGFLVALIAGREASQRCPRCGSALVTEPDTLDAVDEPPRRRRADAAVGDDAQAGAIADAPPADSGTPRASHTPSPALPVRDAMPTVDDAGANAAIGDVAPTRDSPGASLPDAAARAADADPRGSGADAGMPPADPGIDTPASVATGSPHDGPSFMRRRAATPVRHGRRWPWALGLSALAALLALQLLLAQRVELAREAAWRPLVMRACAVFGCAVPAWHEPQAFAMLARGVRPNPARAGVLHVTATVRNDARWPQRAPVVVLSLSDVDGRPVGARAVDPREYGRDAAALVAPGESIDIAFDVREPAARVESFDFQLR